jgi:hypothetical protein
MGIGGTLQISHEMDCFGVAKELGGAISHSEANKLDKLSQVVFIQFMQKFTSARTAASLEVRQSKFHHATAQVN